MAIVKSNLRKKVNILRNKVYERDRGICSHCHVNCNILYRESFEMLKEKGYYELFLWLRIKGFPCNRIKLFIKRGYSLWDAHHIIPVSEGGGDCDVEGMATLCAACHRLETKRHINYIDYSQYFTLFDDKYI
jgi:5-methylcytosine-specific restriction protein A